MLELLPAPDAVVAMRVTGHVDEADIKRGIQAVDSALDRHRRVSLFAEIEISGMTPGAFARDLGYGLSKIRELNRFPRAAIVTSQDWVRGIAWMQGRILPQIEIRTFSPSERDAAMAWISQPLPEMPPEPASPPASVQVIRTDRPGILAFEVNGRIRRDDMRTLMRTFEQALGMHDRVRVLVRVNEFDGVSVDALRVEGLASVKLRGLRQIERYALVGGPDWMEGLVRRAAPWVQIDTRHFDRGEETQAWEWLTAGFTAGESVSVAFLAAFAEAWNRHDVDAILAAMTPDCVFQQSSGPDANGRRFAGQEQIRKAVEEIFAATPDAQWNNPKHFVAGDRGASEWVFTGTGPNGRVEVEGCDLFTFREGRIAVKNSFRKQRTG